MAEDYNWDHVNGQATLRLKAENVVSVPASVVAQAQKSYDQVHYHADGKPQFNEDGSPLMTTNLRYKFPDAATAAKFAVLVKRAGKLTTPQTTVSAVIDPDMIRQRGVAGTPVDPTVVAWSAGPKRGPRGK